MRKSAKVGLAAFIIIMSVLIAVVGSACIMIFVRPDFPMPRYTKENMDSLIEKLPAVDDDSFTADDNNTVMRELVLNQGELNALLALRGKGNVGFSWENISVIFEVEGASAEIREEQLTLTVKMDDICSPTGYEAFDNVLKGAVARVRMEADNNVRVTGLKLNNIDSSVVPEAGFTVLIVKVRVLSVKGITPLFIRYSVSPTKILVWNCFSAAAACTLNAVMPLSSTSS